MVKKITLLSACIVLVFVTFYFSSTYFSSKPISKTSSSDAPVLLVETRNSTKDFSMIFVGDTGTGNSNEMNVANAIQKHCGNYYCDGVFLLGDNFYPAGISSIDDPQWETKFLKQYTQIISDKYPALGNHDYQGCPSCEVEYTKKNNGWFMPNNYYIIKKNDQTFFVADTEKLDEPQLSLLEKTVSEDARTIVVGHRPLYTNESLHFEETYNGKEKFKQLLCSYNINYINGHSHVMEFFDSLTSCKTSQFTIGTGGADLRSFVTNPTQKATFETSEFGFLSLDKKNGIDTFSFWDTTNTKLFSITRK
jgi:hypothetical protein